MCNANLVVYLIDIVETEAKIDYWGIAEELFNLKENGQWWKVSQLLLYGGDAALMLDTTKKLRRLVV